MRAAFALALALIVAPELCSATTEEGKAWLAANAEKDGVVELPCAAMPALLAAPCPQQGADRAELLPRRL